MCGAVKARDSYDPVSNTYYTTYALTPWFIYRPTKTLRNDKFIFMTKTTHEKPDSVKKKITKNLEFSIQKLNLE